MADDPRRPRALASLLLLLLMLAVAGTAPAQTQLAGEALVTALRSGGYSIYFRHAATEWSQQDRVRGAGDWRSCDPAEMRQLTDAGRETARRIGEAIRRLGIPVGRILSSEYCRAAETARLLDLGPVTTTPSLMNMRAAALVGGRDAVIRLARDLLMQAPPPGSNTVLVAHGNLMRAATGSYAGEAGAGIFKAEPGGGLRLVAELAPEDWPALARRFAGE